MDGKEERTWEGRGKKILRKEGKQIPKNYFYINAS